MASPVVCILPDVVYLVILSPAEKDPSDVLLINPEASLGELPTELDVKEKDLPDNPSGAAIPVSNIFIVLVAISGIAAGLAVECELIENVIVLVPVPVPVV